jgi:hypothetical protein
MRRDFKLLACIISAMISMMGFAGETETELAKASLNELKVNRFAKHITLPFQAYFNFDYGKNNTQSILYLKPVLPFKLTENYDLIIRTIAPAYERTPTRNFNSVLAGHYINGWGDINPTFFITPDKFESILIGLGPTFFIPSSTNDRYIGTGKWSIGPELVMYYMPKNWVIGFLSYNIWSIAGDAQRPAVNAFQFQYLISYVFDKGWFVSSNPTISANWKSPGNQQWVVPFGGGIGRTIKWNQQAITFGMTGYYNAIRPAGVGPNWQLQLDMEFLFDAGKIKL